MISIEGLDDTVDPSKDNPDTTEEDVTDNSPDDPSDTTTTPTQTSSLTTPGNTGSTTDFCKNNSSYSSLSLTDKNLLFLNERINILNNNYVDLSMNVIKLQNQLKDNAVKSEDDAKDLVGETPIKVTE